MVRVITAAAIVVSVLAVAAVVRAIILPEPGAPRGGVVRHPIDPRQAAVAFGERSHWLQPWRGYLDTPPATRLRDAIGINFNVEPGEAGATAQLLARSGFRRARVEFGWDSLSYRDPTRLRDPKRFRAILGALRRYRIRPLLLLNANHNAPGPTRFFTVRLAEAAPRGAREVRLTPATARRVQAGRSGLNDPDGKAADVIFTAVRSDGAAALSKPLPRALEAGRHPGATLRYQPFGPPLLQDGRPNPGFERTLDGWLGYARTIVRQARSVLGSDAFDVEVWNEQSFGSDFLHQETYYDPPRESGQGDVTQAILRRTVRALRAESSRIDIGDGFASQNPFPSGATSPRGLTAIDKHPYYGIKRFPAGAPLNDIAPLDALGRPSSHEQRGDTGLVRRDRYIPSYDAFFPEYILTTIQTESLIRDLSPLTTDVNGTPHGRRTHPPGGKPPHVWVTEANLDPTGADPSDPSNPGDGPIDRLAPRDVRHLQAKAALRYYTAFVNKGVTAMDLFAVKGGSNLSLVDPRFFGRLDRSRGAYPGDAAGGATTQAVGRLARSLRGARRLRATRPLSLLAVSDDHGHVQFEGDGTRAHPPLFDRDVLAFFPFQLAPRRWLAAVYVMTRNLAKPYGQGSDPRRYDLPAEDFRITIGGVNGRRLRVRATDPLYGTSVGVKVVSRGRHRATIEMPATDSPRLLSLSQR